MAVVGDVTALPLCDGCADLTVAGFVLSHLDDAGRGLSELVRVTKPGGTVLATAFPAGSGAPSHPVKVVVDDVLSEYGYRAPDWYLALNPPGRSRSAAVLRWRSSLQASGSPASPSIGSRSTSATSASTRWSAGASAWPRSLPGSVTSPLNDENRYAAQPAQPWRRLR